MYKIRTILLLFLFLSFCVKDYDSKSYAQNRVPLQQIEKGSNYNSEPVLLKDIDGDKIIDTIYADLKKSKIVCKLSSENFRPMESRILEELEFPSGIRETRKGFEFFRDFNDFNGSGYSCQFRYEKKSKKICLIGISKYNFEAGPDGKGTSNVNILTGKYTGNRQYTVIDSDIIRKIAIKEKMPFPKTYLEDFNDTIPTLFWDKDITLSEKYINADKQKYFQYKYSEKYLSEE